MNTSPARTGERLPPLPHWLAPLGHCRWCGRHDETVEWLEGGGEHAVLVGWFHRECLEAYWIAVSSKAQRLAVARRDHGLCAGCGANAEQAMYSAMVADPRPPFYGWVIGGTTKRLVDQDFRCVANLTWFRPAGPPKPPTMQPPEEWQADHVVAIHQVDRTRPWEEVIRYWSLDNLQTLCLACHKIKCADEAAWRADRRRETFGLIMLPFEQ